METILVSFMAGFALTAVCMMAGMGLAHVTWHWFNREDKPAEWSAAQILEREG